MFVLGFFTIFRFGRYTYEKTLDWYDSDIFFNEISTEMIRIFCEEKNKTENSYYTFLINNQEK